MKATFDYTMTSNKTYKEAIEELTLNIFIYNKGCVKSCNCMNRALFVTVGQIYGVDSIQVHKDVETFAQNKGWI